MKRNFWLLFILGLFFFPLAVKAQVSSDLLKEYLFPINYGANVAQNDVIGLRIYKNTDNKDPMTWYLSNVSNPKSTLPEIKVDGYVAVRDDRTVYIQASNLNLTASPVAFYTNIYVLAYNQNASPETVNIFNQMLANMKFNKNIMDIFCLKSQSDLIKDSLRRDTVRKADVYKLNKIFKSASGLNLSAGTYVQNMSISTWPSWQATLGKQLNATLPIDPLNIMADRLITCTANEQCATGQCSGGYCSACNLGWDPRTCWNEKTLNYQKVDGFVYKYNNGVLTIRYEYPQLTFPETTGCFLGCNLNGQYYPLGSCQANNQYCSASGWVSNVCGDGTVRCNEVCEGSDCSAGCLSCVEHFHSEGSLCVANTEPVTALTQTLSTTEQKRWTGSGLSAAYATSCKANAILDGVGVCHCKTNYHEETVNGASSCVADARTWTCPPKPDHTDWNTADNYQQTWDGQKWIPLTNETTVYSDAPSETNCYFTCAADYSWTGSECVPTIGASCTKDAAVTSVDKWQDTGYVCTATTCIANASLSGSDCFCDSGYSYYENVCHANIGTACSKTLAVTAVNIWQNTNYVCTALTCQANASLNGGNCECNPGYILNSSDACEFDPNQETNIGTTRTVNCEGKPSNSVWNDSSSYVQTLTKTESNVILWEPVEPTIFNSSTPGDCHFNCVSGYVWDNNECRLAHCTGTAPIANATMCTGSNTGLVTDVPWTVVSSPWDGIANDCTGVKCEYRCNNGYYKKGNTCQSFNSFGFVYKFKAQWNNTWGASDQFDLVIKDANGAISFDGSTRDDITTSASNLGAGYGYNYRNEGAIISSAFDDDNPANGIDAGTYRLYINENSSQTGKLDHCEGILSIYVYAFDGTSPILTIPCQNISTTNWWILNVAMPSGLITVPGSAS